MIIGLTGLAGSGKDTVAYIMESRHNFSKRAFADNLKSAASKIFDLPLIAFYQQDLKEVVDPYWSMSPREMLQKLGTEACRNVFGENIWIDSMMKALSSERLSTRHIVITDVRFDNEAEAIRKLGGVILHIRSNRKSSLSEAAQLHTSEAGVSWGLLTDYSLYNTGTLEELPAQVAFVINQLSYRK